MLGKKHQLEALIPSSSPTTANKLKFELEQYIRSSNDPQPWLPADAASAISMELPLALRAILRLTALKNA